MCKQLGQTPKLSEMPMDINDFPQIIRMSLDIFNRLGDRYTSTDLGPLYIGKDLSTLALFFDLYEIYPKHQQLLVLQVVQHIDAKTVNKAMESMKRKAKKTAP